MVIYGDSNTTNIFIIGITNNNSGYNTNHSDYIWLYDGISYYIAGWWLTYPSEKYEFVKWEYDIPNIWKNIKCSKPQPYSYWRLVINH